METFVHAYPAARTVHRRAHVGVVGSGDLEILVEPGRDGRAQVTVNTSVDGFATVWKSVLDRFFSRFDACVTIEINDFGATPGVVLLRLGQVAETLDK